jgi:hypothetical protein
MEESKADGFGSLQHKKKNKSVFGKIVSSIKGSDTVDDDLLSQLIEMGFELEVAKRNLKKAKNEISRAIDLIREEELIGVQIYSGEELVGLNPIGKLLTSNTRNIFVKMMVYLSDSIEKATQKCFICHDPLDAESIKLRTCNKDICEYR